MVGSRAAVEAAIIVGAKVEVKMQCFALLQNGIGYAILANRDCSRSAGTYELESSLMVADEELLLVKVRGNSDIEEADHHFVVGLVAPGDGTVGIGIVQVVA